MSFKKCKDLILGIFMLAFGGFYYYFATKIKTRPKLTPSYAGAQVLPRLLGILLMVMSVFLIIQAIRKMKAPADDTEKTEKLERGDLIAVVLTFAVIIGYTVLLSIGAGFCLSTIIYLIAQMCILAPKEKRNIGLFALIAVIFTAFLFVAFRIGLQQLLPRGIIESLLGF